jgi:7,8-dihydropterin-6-yl-methyl-4-(beta-D-ribofuranosyl)aminobenzene 5'-phosphate synthase
MTGAAAVQSLRAVSELTLQVISDNSVRAGMRGLLGEHGFSAVLSAGGESVLFDTGQTGSVVASNLRTMGIVPPGRIVLSHGHYDHSGGLLEYAKICPKPCPLFTQGNAFKKRLKKVGGGLQDISMPFSKDALIDAGYRIHESDAPELVSNWLTTSGIVQRESFELPETEFFIVGEGAAKKDPFLDDSAAAVNVLGKGLVMVTGCAHSGVVNTARHFRRLLGEERIHAIVGGFHLVDASEEKMVKTISALGELDPAYIVPGHCTGKDAACALKDAFRKRVIFSEAGLEKVF